MESEKPNVRLKYIFLYNIIGDRDSGKDALIRAGLRNVVSAVT